MRIRSASRFALPAVKKRVQRTLMYDEISRSPEAGLIDLVRKGYFNKEENILFIHTGGSPALYVYISDILEE